MLNATTSEHRKKFENDEEFFLGDKKAQQRVAGPTRADVSMDQNRTRIGVQEHSQVSKGIEGTRRRHLKSTGESGLGTVAILSQVA